MSNSKKKTDSKSPENSGYGRFKGLGMYTWFRGANCNTFPRIAGKPGLPLHPQEYTVWWFRKNLCQGLTPEKPFITKSTYITALGSCFAQLVKDHLLRHGFSVDPHDTLVTRFGAGMVNVYTILQQFKWAYGLQEYDKELWVADRGVVADHGNPSRKRVKSVFDRAEVVIITLGLSEVWYNKQTGGVFWRAIPKKLYNPSKHAFRYLTHAETKSVLQELVEVIRANMGQIPIIFTVSPVRMVATFRPIQVLVANSSSKATLRSAINEVVDESDSDVYYWPSYDFVELYPNPYRPDGCHIKPEVTDTIMTAFRREFTLP